jgi:hypothetical protein
MVLVDDVAALAERVAITRSDVCRVVIETGGGQDDLVEAS